MKVMKIKKALGIAMTTAMVFTMAMPAFAGAVNVQDPAANTKPSTAPIGYNTDDTQVQQDTAATNQVDATLYINYVPGNDHVFEAIQIFSGDISNKFGEGNGRVLSNVKWGSGLKLDGTDHEGKANPASFITALMNDSSIPNTVTDAVNNTGKSKTLAADMSAQDFAEYLGYLNNEDATLRQIAQTITSNNGAYLSGTIAGTSGAAEAYSPDKKYTDTGVEMFKYKIEKLPAGYYITRDQSGVQDPELENLTRNILKLVGDSYVNTKSDTIRSYKKVQENTNYEQNDKINSDDDNTDPDANKPGYEAVNGQNGDPQGTFGQGYNDTADYEIGDTIPFEFIAPIIKPEEIARFKVPYTYTFHDTMSKGLTLDENSFVVAIFSKNETSYDIDNAKKVLTGSEYTYSGIQVQADGSQKFSIKIEDMRPWIETNGIEKNDVIVVRFTAKLNDQAVIGQPSDDPNDKNYQRMYLEYTNNPNGDGTGETPEDENVVFTYELDVTKVDGQDQQVRLEDASFVFYKVIDGVKNYAITKTVNGKTQFVRWEVPESGELKELVATYTTGQGGYTQSELDNWNQNWADADKATFKGRFDEQFNLGNGETVVLVSRADGSFEIQGLDDTRDKEGNHTNPYFLHEIKAPKGYNLMDSDIRVELTADTNNGQNSPLNLGKLQRKFDVTNRLIDPNPNQYKNNPDLLDGQFTGTDDDKVYNGIVDGAIANNRGTVLPSTGGMGTTLFYAIGGVLLVGAAVLLVTRKRVEA